LHPELAIHHRLFLDDPPIDATPETAIAQPAVEPDDGLDSDPPPPTIWQKTAHGIAALAWTLFGEHGLLVHFPVIILGVAGMFAVMHRHWPVMTKILAASSAIATLIGVVGFCASRYGPATADFANRWLIVFLPFLFFWAGAWLRRPHSRPVWSVAGILLVFSVLVSLIGATNPMPAGGYSKYTAVSALRGFLQPTPQITGTALADR
jgi:hypothetical protein